MNLLIDVRTTEEYAERHAPGSLHLPLMAIACGNFGVLAGVDKGERIELYCRSGQRSEQAKQFLLQAGFTDVVNLGGLDDVMPGAVPQTAKISFITFLKKLWNQ